MDTDLVLGGLDLHGRIHLEKLVLFIHILFPTSSAGISRRDGTRMIFLLLLPLLLLLLLLLPTGLP